MHLCALWHDAKLLADRATFEIPSVENISLDALRLSKDKRDRVRIVICSDSEKKDLFWNREIF